MDNQFNQNAIIIQNLNSEDAAVRRETAESLMYSEIPNDVVKLLAAKLSDPDKGVRDSVNVALTYNANPDIPQFVVPFIASEDIAIRNLAGDILLKRGTNSINELVKFLDQGDDDAKKFIIDILGLIGDLSPKDEIVAVLKQTINENVALACIEAIGNIKAIDAIPVLIEEFDKNELYRPTIAESLGKIESDASLDFILNRFEDVDELTQFSMLESLGKIGSEETFFFLLTHLKRAQPPLTWAIISSIRLLRDKFLLDIPYDEGTKNAVLSTLLSSDIEYRKAAASLLTLFRDDEVFDTCFAVYGVDFEIDSGIQTIFFENIPSFFEKINDYLKIDQTNLKSLLELTKNLIDFDQGEGLYSLGELGVHNMSERLSECLTHPNEDVRRLAMELIFFVKPETAFVFIDTMSADNNTWNRLRLVEILENYDVPESNTILDQLANDKEEMVVQRVSWIINQRRNK